MVNTGLRKTSTRDIALEAGVSHATVSYVLNGRNDRGISEETRRRVLESAKKLNYRQNRVAPSVFRGYTQMLGVLMPDNDNSFFARILSGVQRACHERDFAVQLTYTERDPEVEFNDVNRMLEHRVAGILVVETGLSRATPHPWLNALVAEKIPCVMVDDADASDYVDCVVSDDVQGAKLVMEHLLEHGHKRIAFLTGECVTSSVRARQTGYAAVMRGAGLDAAKYVRSQAYSAENIARAVESLLADPNPPTAIFANTDYAAEVVLAVLACMNVKVPTDMAVVGYADTELSRGLQLTTVHQDAQAMGYVAATRLLDRIAGDVIPNDIVRISNTLVLRKSCGCPGEDLSLAFGHL
ncbi:MAG TPA: LacI family DNA-binding transcriptional regulator [Capsulimonadaceae bacterium]